MDQTHFDRRGSLENLTHLNVCAVASHFSARSISRRWSFRITKWRKGLFESW